MCLGASEERENGDGGTIAHATEWHRVRLFVKFVLNALRGANLNASVSGIPSGRTIYVRLLSWINGGWQANDATYTSN